MRAPRLGRRPRRWWLRATLLVLLDLLVALVVGVTTASVHGSFGPHEARYDVTTDSTVTVSGSRWNAVLSARISSGQVAENSSVWRSAGVLATTSTMLS